jgi:hypothetical protein
LPCPRTRFGKTPPFPGAHRFGPPTQSQPVGKTPFANVFAKRLYVYGIPTYLGRSSYCTTLWWLSTFSNIDCFCIGVVALSPGMTPWSHTDFQIKVVQEVIIVRYVRQYRVGREIQELDGIPNLILPTYGKCNERQLIRH